MLSIFFSDMHQLFGARPRKHLTTAAMPRCRRVLDKWSVYLLFTRVFHLLQSPGRVEGGRGANGMEAGASTQIVYLWPCGRGIRLGKLPFAATAQIRVFKIGFGFESRASN